MLFPVGISVYVSTHVNTQDQPSKHFSPERCVVVAPTLFLFPWVNAAFPRNTTFNNHNLALNFNNAGYPQVFLPVQYYERSCPHNVL